MVPTILLFSKNDLATLINEYNLEHNSNFMEADFFIIRVVTDNRIMTEEQKIANLDRSDRLWLEAGCP